MLASETNDAQQTQPPRSFESSDTFAKLAVALAKAQAEMTVAEQSGTNPDLNKKYATLADLRRACVPYLAKHELAILQIPRTGTNMVEVKTLLIHSSGEWIACTLHVMSASPMTVWQIGTATTYLRRYGMGAIVALASEAEEDDGAALMRASPPPPMSPDRFPVPQQSRTDAVREKLAGKAAETAAPKQAAPPSPKPTSEASKPAVPPQPKPGESPPAAAPPKQEPPPATLPAAPPEPTPATAPTGPPVADNIKQIQDWLKAIGEVRKREAFITITTDFKKQADSGAFDKGQVNAILAALKAKGYEMAKYFISAATSAQQLEQAEQLCDLTFSQSDSQVGELSSMLAAKASDLKKKG